MRNELLPCPFCGGYAHAETVIGAENIEYTGIVCWNCGAIMPGNYDTVGDKAEQNWNTRTSGMCHYLPDVMNTAYDEDDNEIDTNETHPDGCDYSCDYCGYQMIADWFDKTPGKYGGYNYKPRFKYCPECGRKVVPWETN